MNLLKTLARDQTFVCLCVLFAAIVASIGILATMGCGAPCSDHGGIRQLVGNGVYVCNDGTWV